MTEAQLDLARVRDLLPAFALGDLDPAERALVERALDRPEIANELREWHELLAGVAEHSSRPVAPSAHVRARLLREVKHEAALARPLAAARWWPGLVAAALAFLVLWGGYRMRELERRVGSFERERAVLRSQVEQAVSQLEHTERRVVRLATAMQLVNAPDTRLVRLARLELGAEPRGSGAAFVHGGARAAIFYAYNLAPPAEGRDYQLWYIGAAGPESAGVFELDSNGNALVSVADLPDVASIQTWAVTVEPKGGVPQPTGPMILAG